MKCEDKEIVQELINYYGLSEEIKGDKNLQQVFDILLASTFQLNKWRPNFMESNPLSLRESLSLILFAMGQSSKRCADLLAISVHTLETYERRARKKLGAMNRLHSFALAVEHRYIISI